MIAFFMKNRKRRKKPASKLKKLISRILLIAAIVLGCYLYYTIEIKSNFRTVIDGQIYRSAQPKPDQLRGWIKKYNLKTIVTLRGASSDLSKIEGQIAKDTGTDINYFRLSAYRLIPADQLLELINVIETGDKPMLLHCRQGIDRAGTASALAVWFLTDASYSDAKWHSFVPPHPWKRKKGPFHISDTFKQYQKYCKEKNLDPDNKQLFKTWAATCVYNITTQADIPNEFLTNQQLDVTVTIGNDSLSAIKLSDLSKKFSLSSRIASQTDDLDANPPTYASTALPKQDLAPNESIKLIHHLRAPPKPGIYDLSITTQEASRSTIDAYISTTVNKVISVKTASDPNQI